MFIIGIGSLDAKLPPRYWYNGKPSPQAAALAVASDAPRIAFAPNLSLFGVPSASNII